MKFILRILIRNNFIRSLLDKIIRKFSLWKYLPNKCFDPKKYSLSLNKYKYIYNLTGGELAEINWIEFQIQGSKVINQLSEIPVHCEGLLVVISNTLQLQGIRHILFNFVRSNQIPIALYHCSDEANNHNISIYRYFDIIFRNHFSISYVMKNLFICPLGPFKKSFISNSSRGNSSKIYTFNYICDVNKSNRRQILQKIISIDDGFIHTYEGWLSDKMLSIEEYSTVLQSSFLTICPPGFVSGDCFRIWESLLCNSLPVIIINSDIEWLFKYWSLEHLAVMTTLENLPNVLHSNYHSGPVHPSQLLLNAIYQL